MIQAEVHSDDFVFKIPFDATAWFEQARDSDVLDLASIDWRGDYAADDVAEFFEDTKPEIANLMDYCRKKDGIGFECSVNSEQALAWIKEHRSEWVSTHPMLYYQAKIVPDAPLLRS